MRAVDTSYTVLFAALAYEDMNTRRNHLAKVRAKHLEWIWARDIPSEEPFADEYEYLMSDYYCDNYDPKFVEWLLSEESFFWISGKPASGKSTLMKYISGHPRCAELLQQATGRQWLTVHFFFDFRAHKGTANTIEGMLRSLLCQLIRNSSTIAGYIGNMSFWQFADLKYNDLSQDQLQVALTSSIANTDNRVCIFVDGLDEFEESYYDLVEALQLLGHGKRVKICLASRPEPAIAHSLRGVPSIKMQDYNRGTIRAYTEDCLSNCAHYLDGSQNLLMLVDHIVKESHGVILWSQLVCRDVREGMLAFETVEELLARIVDQTAELDQIYDRIFRKIDPRSKSESLTLLYLIAEHDSYSGVRQLKQLSIWLARQGMLGSFPMQGMNTHDFQLRLNSRLGGLIDLETPEDGDGTVGLIHKTLRTYLDKSQKLELELPQKFRSSYPDHVSPGCSRRTEPAGWRDRWSRLGFSE